MSAEIVLGRDEADVDLDDAEISRRHVVIRPVEAGLEVEDLASHNGTFVDGTRITEVMTVGNGAVVVLGQTTLGVEVAETVDRHRTRTSVPRKQTVTSAPEPAELTQIRETPLELRRLPPAEPPPPAPQPEPEPVAASAVPAPAARRPNAQPAARPDQPFGHYRPGAARRGRKIQSRLWVPEALTYTTVLATAAALVWYFAEH